MKNNCSTISKLLEKYLDQEVTDAERSLVEGHIPDCPACREVLHSMKSLGNLIRNPVEEAVGKESFPWVWQKIEKEGSLKEELTWWETLRDWLEATPLFRKRVLIPAAAVMIIFILITAPLLFEKTSSYPGPSVVEYIESQTYNVMVYEPENAKVTVIWLFEGPEEELSTS
jgi:hypothetical protein